MGSVCAALTPLLQGLATAEWADHFIELMVQICNLPVAARVIFNVAYKDGTPIGWAGCNAFDFQHQLISGSISLQLWPGSCNSFLAGSATSLSNRYGSQTVVLDVAFQTFPRPVVNLSAEQLQQSGLQSATLDSPTSAAVGDPSLLISMAPGQMEEVRTQP